MAQLEILIHPDPRLRLPASPVSDFDGELDQFVDDLLETLYATNGIGLSATQVGDQRNVLVIDLSEDRTAPEIYINPKIHSKSEPGLVEESCLSVPGVVGNVVRATKVSASAQDRTGKVFESEMTGMHAVCLQHEMDHLEGKLFIDRLSVLEKLRIRLASALRGRKSKAASA